MSVQQVNFGLWYFVFGSLVKMTIDVRECIRLTGNIPGLKGFSIIVEQAVHEGECLAGATKDAAMDLDLPLPNLSILLTDFGEETGTLAETCLSAALMIYNGDRRKLFSDFYELTGLNEDWQMSLNAFGRSISNGETFRASLQEASEHHLDTMIWEDIADAVLIQKESFIKAVVQKASATPLTHPIIFALLGAGEASGTLDEITLFLTPTFEDDEQKDSYRGFDKTWIIDLELLRLYLDSGYDLCIALTYVAERSPHKPVWTAIKDGVVQADGNHFLSEVIKKHAPDTPLANADFLHSLEGGEQYGRLQDGVREFFPEDVVGRIIGKGLPPELYLFHILQDSGYPVLRSLQTMDYNTNELKSVIDEVQGGSTVAEAIDPEGRIAKRNGYAWNYLNDDTIFRFLKAGQDTSDLKSALKTLSYPYNW